MSKLLREPLLHFAILGGALFLVYGRTGSDDAAELDRKIVVSAARVSQLEAVFRKAWKRDPTEEELRGLVDDFVLEEAYYRRAVSMGIDRDDTVIRRRLRTKLEFLTDEAAKLGVPSDDELAKYLAANPAPFRAAPSYGFRQHFFDAKTRGDAAVAFVEARLADVRAGKEIASDESKLPAEFARTSRTAVEATFGVEFVTRLDSLAVGEWQGPISSKVGLHLVRVEIRSLGGIPPLAEIRDDVLREWQNEKRAAARGEFDASLLKEFDVQVEWPKGEGEES